MFETISEHSQGESFDFGYRLLPTLAVGHDAWQIGDFRYPPAIGFAFNFDTHVYRPPVRAATQDKTS